MESAGWQRTEVTDFRKSTYKLYTEEQKKIFLEYEKILREQEKAEADVTINQKKEIDERLKASSAATAAYEKIFSTTKEGQKKAAQDAYTTAEALQKSALDKGAITQAEYDKRITALAQARDEKITAINKRGAKTRLSEAEKEAKKFTEATAQYEAGLKKLRNEVGAMEDALDPSLTKFERLRKQIEAEKKAAIENADVKAKETVRRKQATVAQAQETAELEKRKAVLTATQKLDELENQNLRDKADFYKDLAEKTGRYSTSMEYQNQLLEKQREIWLSMGIPGKDVQEMIRQLQLESSRDPFDGITRGLQGFISEATDGAKAMEDTFSGLFNGMDSGFHSVWEQMLEDGKVSLSSFKSLFASFLADLMHMAITRPITVQIAGVVSGMLGTGGVAYAAGGSGGGGIGNLSGVSNLMPGSWTSGIADTINNTMAGWFPSTFASTSAVSSAANAGVMSATGGAADVAGLKAAEAASSLGGNTTFLSTVSPYLMAGGLGSLGYTMLGGALGLPQSKYSGLTAGLSGAAGWGLGSLAAGSFASIGATMGSVVPVVGTIIGALAGGALGSLFGQQRKTHPSVYGHMIGLGYTTDTQTYIDAFMNQATYDRAGKQEASGYAQVIGEAASQTAGNILDLAAMLPEAYKQSVEEQLASATWSAGRGYSGASWNLQNWKEGMAEERIQEAIDDMFEQMGYGANKAFAEAGIGELFDSFDLSTEEGFKKAQTAISAISSITTAIDQIKTPTTEAEQQAKAFVEQMNALGEAVKASGLNAAYADEMLGEYRTAYVDKYVETLEEMFNPLSQIEQQAKGYKTAIDGYVAALTTMQASEEQLAQVRGYTQDAIDSITGSLDAAFFPLSDVEQQTKATMESLLAYKAALETLGASTEELTRIDAAWGKMQSDLLDKARDYVRTTPQIVSQSAAMNAEFDALREAMLLAGNATADLTELERTRAQAVAAMQAQYAESFRQTYAQRYATLTGDTNGLAVLQQQASFSSELAEIEKTWGKDSLQYKQMQALQEAEAAKLRLEQAQADADRLAQLRLEREKLVMQTSVDSSKARLDALKAEKSAAEKLKSTWEDVLATIYKTRLNMYQSDDNLDLFGRLATAQGEFDRLYGLAIGGDAEAAKEMASVSSGLLDLRKETSATSAEYLDAFYGVDKKLKDVSGIASKQVSAADRQLAALGSQLSVQEAQYGVLSAQLSALGSQNATLASIDAQIAGLKGVLSGLDSAKGDYQSALDKGNEIKPNTGVYGSNYLTEYDLMAAKVASLNRGEYIDPNFGIPAGGWTIANARQAMLDTYGSVPEWYKNAGKIEGFAKGGLASGWGIAGEYGPELIDFSTPGRVYTAEQTRQILMPPAVGTDGSLVAEIAKLREQNKEMARELRIANARLEKMEKYAKETKDGVDEIRVVGIPVTVEA
ncbi:phage tail tape measure C-terminal domain-containing protein [Bilophila wadsworthia]|uniref:phage tail tape measure C-terminal domain-containing protein n=1 Tax=Bilophila wadsworthia TaxID=35833 RepID=UPI003AB41B86